MEELIPNRSIWREWVDEDVEKFQSILPTLWQNPDISIYQKLYDLYYFLDIPGMGKKHFPGEVEAVFLTGKPGVESGMPSVESGKPILRQAMLGITALNDFQSAGISTLKTSRAWQQIARLSLSFRFWRYDAERNLLNPISGKPESLFDRYGFKFLESQNSTGRFTDHKFGPGYVLTAERYNAHHPDKPSPLSAQTLVEFRRGYLLASHPEHGTLLIRNSTNNPDFPIRKTIGRFAYYSPKFYKEDKLFFIDPSNPNPNGPDPVLNPNWMREAYINWDFHQNFNHILSPKAYLLPDPDEDGLTQAMPLVINDHLKFLVGELLKVKEDYRQWKFNIPAITAGQGLSYNNSPGYQHILELLVNWGNLYQDGIDEYGVGDATERRSGKLPPRLAFVNPNEPIFRSDSYDITPEHLSELSAIRGGWMTGEDWIDSDFRVFIENGIRGNKELVLLAPRGDAS